MTEIFAALGVDTTGGEFVRVEEKYTDKQVQINVVSKLKDMGLPMSDDYLYRTFDVEKPDDYDALKRDIDETRLAAEERSRQLADRLNRGDVSTKGTNVLKLIIVVAILSLIASLISSFMGGMVASVTAAVLLIVSLILNIIKYFMYLSFLSRLKKSLVEG